MSWRMPRKWRRPSRPICLAFAMIPSAAGPSPITSNRTTAFFGIPELLQFEPEVDHLEFLRRRDPHLDQLIASGSADENETVGKLGQVLLDPPENLRLDGPKFPTKEMA